MSELHISLCGLHWKEWLGTRLGHLQTWASASLLGEGRLFVVMFALAVTLQFVFSIPILLCLMLVLQGCGATLVLQQLADPTPLFWTAPAEVCSLIGNKRARANHLWLHKTQDLINDGIQSRCGAGYATRDGFVLLRADTNELQVLVAAEAALHDLERNRGEDRFLKGCKTFRLIAAALFLLVVVLTLAALRRLQLSSFLLAVVLASGFGHEAGRDLERIIGSWLPITRVWREQKADVVVAPFAVPRLLWFEGGQGFLVRRVGQVPTHTLAKSR